MYYGHQPWSEIAEWDLRELRSHYLALAGVHLDHMKALGGHIG